MAMVVVILHKITWSYTTLSTSYRLPEAICVAMATCNFVGKMLLTSISLSTVVLSIGMGL